MERPRFSIASLLVVIGVIGIALAALRNPSYMWANVTFSVAFAAILMAIINTIYGRGARRAYWLGFALCGGIYFATCSVPGIRESICPRLATEMVFDLLYPNVSPPPAAPPPPSHLGVLLTQNELAMANGPTVPAPPPTLKSRWSAWNQADRTYGLGYPIGTVSLVSSEAFRQIGHALATLLVAVLGGSYAQRRFRAVTRDDPREPGH
jgi:hypothetical protein